MSGKTGNRRIWLVASTLALQGWLNEHHARNDQEAYLWRKIPTPNNPKRKNDHLCYGFIVKILEELSGKAGIMKAVNDRPD